MPLVQLIDLMLTKIAGDHLMTELNLAAIRSKASGDDLEQCRLACSVRPDQRDTFTTEHLHVHVIVHHVVVEAFGHMTCSTDEASRSRRFREAEATHLLSLVGRLDTLEFFKHLHPRLHHRSL